MAVVHTHASLIYNIVCLFRQKCTGLYWLFHFTWCLILNTKLLFSNLAHELRAWILHHSVAVLHGILPNTYYQHHLLLVEAIFLLLQEQITRKEVRHSLELLKHYCFLFGTLYGMRTIFMCGDLINPI